jgi:hypothetical protein
VVGIINNKQCKTMNHLDSSFLHIGKNRRLFFDNMIIERVQDITRTHYDSFQSIDDPQAKSSIDPDLSRKLSVRKWE